MFSRIPVRDFKDLFSEVCICRMPGKPWRETRLFGSWRSGTLRAGGLDRSGHPSPNNPQYMFDVPPGSDSKTLWIQLSQADVRRDNRLDNYQRIGFQIVRVEANRAYRLHGTNHNSQGSWQRKVSKIKDENSKKVVIFQVPFYPICLYMVLK